MGNSPSRVHLTPFILESLLSEYKQLGGVHAESHTAGWTDTELTWLLTAFVERCSQLEQLKLENQEQEDKKHAVKSKIENVTKEAKHGESHKKKDKKKEKKCDISIGHLQLKQSDAAQYIVIFNQSFVSYPFLSDRFWAVLDRGNTKSCNFLDYTTLLYYIVRGSFEDRAKVAFQLFDTKGANYIQLDEVIEVVSHISEFICNVARGLLTMKEFNNLKLIEVGKLFEQAPSGKLDLAQFTKLSETHFSLLSCYEILDMVFGRVVRKMEVDLKRPFVFGRHLQETSLGNVKDITGEMPFVPEVIASAIHFMREKRGLGTPELFRISVSNQLQTDIRDKLNAGTTLRGILSSSKFNSDAPTEDDFMLLASLIKLFCRELKEPVFTRNGARQILVIQDSNQSAQLKLEGFQRVFDALPVPNRYFLGTLLPFLKEVDEAQRKSNSGRAMTSSNLGVVFAPCLLYDPEDASFGALSAPNAFSVIIDNASLFAPSKGKRITLTGPNPALGAMRGANTSGTTHTPPASANNSSSSLPLRQRPPPPARTESGTFSQVNEVQHLKTELQMLTQERDALRELIKNVHTLTKPKILPSTSPRKLSQENPPKPPERGAERPGPAPIKRKTNPPPVRGSNSEV